VGPKTRAGFVNGFEKMYKKLLVQYLTRLTCG
jgi:hypothetical protein